MEVLDILDEKGNNTAVTATYEEAHHMGLKHRAVHIWILNNNKEILLQKRSKDRRVFARHWDISAAGHVSSGQTSVEAAQRETKEELNLDFILSDFKFLFTLYEESILNNGSFVNNEFSDTYMVQADISLSDIKLLDGEVDEVRFVSIDKFKKLIEGQEEDIVPHPEEYKRLLSYIELNLF